MKKSQIKKIVPVTVLAAIGLFLLFNKKEENTTTSGTINAPSQPTPEPTATPTAPTSHEEIINGLINRYGGTPDAVTFFNKLKQGGETSIVLKYIEHKDNGTLDVFKTAYLNWQLFKIVTTKYGLNFDL